MASPAVYLLGDMGSGLYAFWLYGRPVKKLGAFMATIGVFFPSFFILVLLIPYHDRLRGVEKVRMMEQGVLGSFIGMLALVLYNFGRTSLVDIPRILMAAAAFFAIYKKSSLPYILLAGGMLSILIYGFLF